LKEFIAYPYIKVLPYIYDQHLNPSLLESCWLCPTELCDSANAKVTSAIRITVLTVYSNLCIHCPLSFKFLQVFWVCI